jgi:hypothetical protein
MCYGEKSKMGGAELILKGISHMLIEKVTG